MGEFFISTFVILAITTGNTQQSNDGCVVSIGEDQHSETLASPMHRKSVFKKNQDKDGMDRWDYNGFIVNLRR